MFDFLRHDRIKETSSPILKSRYKQILPICNFLFSCVGQGYCVRKIINQFFLLDCIRSNNKRRVTLKISAARELNENYWLPTNPITAVSVNTSHTPILHPAGIFFLVRAVCTHTVTPTDSNFCVIFRRIFWRIIFHIQYLRCRAVVRVAGLWCLYIFEHTFIIIRHLWVWIKYLRAVTSLVLQLIQIFSILCNQEETKDL